MFNKNMQPRVKIHPRYKPQETKLTDKVAQELFDHKKSPQTKGKPAGQGT